MSLKSIKQASCLTLTFLADVSLGSLNGGDKETDNISPIKKLSRGAEQFPYMSSQALRRGMREQLAVLKDEKGQPRYQMSEGIVATEKKGAATTKCDPYSYIDDDLFGFMNAQKGKTVKRTSPLRVSPMIALAPYRGDLDFGTNYMSVKQGGDPNIFETEIHGAWYRGSLLLELDRVGSGDGFEGKELSGEEKAARVLALLEVLQGMWATGRQTRFLSDISPKFVAFGLTTTKTPLFLESVRFTREERLDYSLLKEVLSDNDDLLVRHALGARSSLFPDKPEEVTTVGDAFQQVKQWLADFYKD